MSSLFLLMLLFINPKILSKTTINEKPVLTVLIDNSSSINFFNEAESVKDVTSKLRNNKGLQDKFDIREFKFGTTLQNYDSLSFSENNTNIYKALKEVNNLESKKKSPIILISDGNQTIGSDYEYVNSNNSIYPVVVGDTTKYTDVRISQLNVNKYSFIKNKFPVEVLLNYEGQENVSSQFLIQQKGKTIFRKTITFSKNKTSETIQTNLTANQEGVLYYKASIQKIENEKNITNNEKNFSVEVINEQRKILILSSVLHPDLGALKKAIEVNKQNSVDVKQIEDFNKNISDYQLVILYQPNNKFSQILSNIKQKKANYLFISGLNTDWTSLNTRNLGFTKNAINQKENYSASFNANYITFLQEDIGFENYPPLEDKFGRITFQKEPQVLLYQQINGIETQDPLLGTFAENNQKVGFIFGENMWKWRANNFLETNSFEAFDKFIGNLMQYLASNKKRNRLEINSQPLYNANSTINITAFYRDENYKFDNRANLELSITNNKTKEIKKLPFSLVNSSYQVSIENLNSGDYNYQVQVIGQKISRNGNFKITDYEIEEQFTNANVTKMKQLAEKSSGKIYFKNTVDNLVNHLITNDSYLTIQKQITKEKQLVDWKWMLFAIVSLLAIEWFLRKYLGKI